VAKGIKINEKRSQKQASIWHSKSKQKIRKKEAKKHLKKSNVFHSKRQ
jgi:hypothetical protein